MPESKLRVADLAAESVRGINAPRVQRVQQIADSMRSSGWNGPPLLVEESEQGFFAWTGSHRIEAARLAHLDVRCLVLSQADADRAFSAMYDRNGYSCWRDAVTGIEGPYDQDRLQALQRVGLSEAALELEAEIKRQDDDWYEQLGAMVTSVQRHHPATYAGWLRHLRTGNEGPESAVAATIGGGVLWLMKLKYQDPVSRLPRFGLFDLEHYRRVRGKIDVLRPLVSIDIPDA